MEKLYFTGTLDSIDSDEDIDEKDCKPHHIRYDDGDGEWTNLFFRKFTLCKKQINHENGVVGISNNTNDMIRKAIRSNQVKEEYDYGNKTIRSRKRKQPPAATHGDKKQKPQEKDGEKKTTNDGKIKVSYVSNKSKTVEESTSFVDHDDTEKNLKIERLEENTSSIVVDVETTTNMKGIEDQKSLVPHSPKSSENVTADTADVDDRTSVQIKDLSDQCPQEDDNDTSKREVRNINAPQEKTLLAVDVETTNMKDITDQKNTESQPLKPSTADVEDHPSVNIKDVNNPYLKEDDYDSSKIDMTNINTPNGSENKCVIS